MKKTFVIHPFLLAVSPILFLFAHNIYEVSFSEILLPISIVLIFTTLSLLLLKLILKDSKKAGFGLSIFLILFFSFGYIRDAVSGLTIGNILIGRQRYLLLIWCILIGVSSYFIVRMRKDLRNLTNFLNITTISFVAISIIIIGLYEIRKIGAVQIDNEVSENIQINTKDLRNLPARDIYYIILDSYTNSSTLKDTYKYDNYEFTDYLTKKGFYVGFKSRSNYPITVLSLASSLNMEYVNYLSDSLGIESRDLTILNEMRANSKVMKFLKSKGYKFINIATYNNKYADISLKRPTVWSEFNTMLVNTTMLLPFTQVDQFRDDTLFSFSKLAEAPSIEGPKFVFAHILCPHPPFVFGANGETTQAFIGNFMLNEARKQAYVNQLIFVSKKTKVIIDDILSKSKIPPVIILQADHGMRLSDLSWNVQSPNDELIRENFGILNAYYLPPDGNKLLYDSISPVNSFRLIFNYYFNTDYKLLDDLSYYTTGYRELYKLTDVTDRIKY
ncbi:MAG: hypothetical protein QG588_931 [Candidatus Poribacteria bacterium]|nr:hypothetical protein [Candidatus Poribacteria bacterium]